MPVGLNNAHGPACDAFGGCENHDSAASFEHAFVNPNLNFGLNVGAWNGVFQNQSPSDKSICGIWATQAEADAVGESGSPTCDK